MLNIVFTCIRQESANKWYRNTVKDRSSFTEYRKKDEKPDTVGLDDTAVPHIKINITEITLEKMLNTVISRRLLLKSPGLSNARKFGGSILS